MNAIEGSREFVDSNVLIYSVDPSARQKGERARMLLQELWRRRAGCVSIQVLQEFYVTVTAKLPRPLSLAEGLAKAADFAEWTLHQPGKSDLLSAMGLQRDARVSFWDAMILQSARQMRCGILWTEDLNDGQRYAGVLVRNPFVDTVMDEGDPESVKKVSLRSSGADRKGRTR
jgi:predicted nucleic acid-binding protein